MSIEIPPLSPPPSPFPVRPDSKAASSSAAPPSSSSSATTSTPISTPPPGRFLPVEYPLTSFASTPHNVASIGFVLGAVWAVGLCLALPLLFGNFLIWSPSSSVEDLGPQGLLKALKSPVLGVYLASWAFFHLAEFLVTSMYNPAKLSVASYLLNNGNAYHVAHFFGMMEHVLEEAFLPPQWRRFKHLGPLVLLGWGLVVGGQIMRSFAMITASSNFSHIIAYKKLETHQLVTNGIYAWSRHPSYAGFTWWAIGTQVLLVNPVGILAFSIVVYQFFSGRIKTEEQLLIKFFGDEYIKYRQRVPTRILFIN